jgi:superfamily II DNA or RNA helicase
VLARSIEHAQEVVRLFAEKNIRATRVTVDYADISTDEAVKQLESVEIEVVVTVMKVAE